MSDRPSPLPAALAAALAAALLLSPAASPAARAQKPAAQKPAAPAARVDARVTTPRAFLGFTPGDDHRLATYTQSAGYFRRLASQSKRVRLFEVGRTSEGRPMFLAAISSERNLARLDRHKKIAKTLAEGRVGEAEARTLAREGRAMVWIDGGLHATEVGCAQHAINLAYDLAAREDAEYRRIRENCVVLLMPTLNPDGQEMVASWFIKHYGTPREGTPLPTLYQKYAGHDNNRDWFMLNLPETRVVTRLLYHEWLPQVVYNHHQAGNMYPERMFVPPYDEPLNPHIPPLAVRAVNAVGTAMHQRLAREGKTGVISLDTYTAWWNGGMRSTPFFHNAIGILTEVAHPSPYPARYVVPPSRREVNGWYPDPYKGGPWRFADTVAYMNAGSLGMLNWAADHPEDLQLDRWRMARAALSRGTSEAPYGFIVPLDAAAQRDPDTAALLLERMRLGGLEVRVAEKPFAQDGKTYPAGTAVLLASQANRPFLIDMFTAQQHPMRRQGPGGPPVRPYDIAGWTPTLQMGVTAVPMTTRPGATSLAALSAPLASELPPPLLDKPIVAPGGAYLLPAGRNASYTVVNRLLAAGVSVERWTTPRATPDGRTWDAGTFVIPADTTTAPEAVSLMEKLYEARRGTHLRLGYAVPDERRAAAATSVRLKPTRVGTYDPYGGSMPEGWARFVLDSFAFPHVAVTNPDLRAGDLSAKVDALILAGYPNVRDRRIAAASATATESADAPAAATPAAATTERVDRTGGLGPGFLGGPAPKELAPEVEARLDGIGDAGEANLRRFVEEGGGTLVALPGAAAKVIELFRLPVRDATKGTKFYSPGSIFRVVAENDDPLAWGLPRDVNIFFDKGSAFEVSPAVPDGPRGGAFAVYPDENPLLSGWIIEDQVIRKKAAGVSYRVGKGRVVVFGFDVTFRGQPHMGFPFLFNALHPTEPTVGAAATATP